MYHDRTAWRCAFFVGKYMDAAKDIDKEMLPIFSYTALTSLAFITQRVRVHCSAGTQLFQFSLSCVLICDLERLSATIRLVSDQTMRVEDTMTEKGCSAYIRAMSKKNPKERDRLEDLNVDGRKWDLKEKWIHAAQDRYQ
jgi:hypothetical protein